MGRFIEIDRQRGVADVTFYGPTSFQERMDTMDHLCPSMAKHRIRRLMLDFSAAWPSGEGGTREELMQKILAEPALHGCRVAFVNSVELKGIPAAPTPNFVVKQFDHRQAAEARLFED